MVNLLALKSLCSPIVDVNRLCIIDNSPMVVTDNFVYQEFTKIKNTVHEMAHSYLFSLSASDKRIMQQFY